MEGLRKLRQELQIQLHLLGTSVKSVLYYFIRARLAVIAGWRESGLLFIIDRVAYRLG